MNILFIDSHDELITVALRKGNEVFTMEKESHYEHGILLMNMIKEIIENNGLKVNDINRIVAINGPGSFTGIRIGLTIAKTLGYSLNIDVHLVGSLESYLISSDYEGDKMSVIEDNKGYYIAVFDKNNNEVIKESYVDDIDNYKYYIVENKLDVNKVMDYALSKKATPFHLVRANYVKKIEVEK